MDSTGRSFGPEPVEIAEERRKRRVLSPTCRSRSQRVQILSLRPEKIVSLGIRLAFSSPSRQSQEAWTEFAPINLASTRRGPLVTSVFGLPVRDGKIDRKIVTSGGVASIIAPIGGGAKTPQRAIFGESSSLWQVPNGISARCAWNLGVLTPSISIRTTSIGDGSVRFLEMIFLLS